MSLCSQGGFSNTSGIYRCLALISGFVKKFVLIMGVFKPPWAYYGNLFGNFTFFNTSLQNEPFSPMLWMGIFYIFVTYYGCLLLFTLDGFLIVSITYLAIFWVPPPPLPPGSLAWIGLAVYSTQRTKNIGLIDVQMIKISYQWEVASLQEMMYFLLVAGTVDVF